MKRNINITIKPMKRNACPEMKYAVGFMAGHYGSGSSCKTEAEVRQAVLSCQKWIRQEGDMPFVTDLRVKQTTLFPVKASQQAESKADLSSASTITSEQGEQLRK